MNTTGTLFLSNTKPLTTVATDGTFALTLLAFDRQGPHTVEPYRITWAGPAAQQFHQVSAASLTPGRALVVHLHRLRSFVNGRNATPEIVCSAKSITLDPYCQATEKQAKTPASPYPASATSY